LPLQEEGASLFACLFLTVSFVKQFYILAEIRVLRVSNTLSSDPSRITVG
jgi:hypothetical protein